MRMYSTERKESVLKKLHPPQNLSYRALSREEGIPLTTIYTWQKQQERAGKVANKTDKGSVSWTAEERFSAIVDTAKLSELDLSAYCREKGLYAEQIKAWKTAFISSGSPQVISGQQEKIRTKADKKRINELEKELRRKEKALAEAAALLILRKKLHAFYEEGSEDD